LPEGVLGLDTFFRREITGRRHEMMKGLYEQTVRKGPVHSYYEYFKYPHATFVDGFLPLASLLREVQNGTQ
jgi:hypothetical protein